MHPERSAASRSETTLGWSSTSILFIPLKGETAFFFIFFCLALCKKRQSSPLLHERADCRHSSPLGNTARISCDARGLLDEGKFVRVTSPGLLRKPSVTHWDLFTQSQFLHSYFWRFWIPWGESSYINIHYCHIFVIGFLQWFDYFENRF